MPVGKKGKPQGQGARQVWKHLCAWDEYQNTIHLMFFVCVCVFVPVPVHGFETEEQFENFVRNDPQSRNVLAAVVFEHHFTHDDEPLPQQVKCSVHTDRQFQKITLFLQRFTRSTC